LIRPLPYNHPDRIVYLRSYSPSGYTQPASYPEYLDWRRDNHVISALAAYNDFGAVNFEGPSGPVALGRVTASDNFFEVFGVQPILGRTFSPGEDQQGKNSVAVLSYEVWREQLDSNPNAIGKTIHLDGRPYTDVGVMPAGFRFPVSQRNIIYTPLNPTRKEQTQSRGNHWLPTIARLKRGITTQQATTDMNRVLDDLGRAYPETRGRRMRVLNLTEFVVGKTAAQAPPGSNFRSVSHRLCQHCRPSPGTRHQTPARIRIALGRRSDPCALDSAVANASYGSCSHRRHRWRRFVIRAVARDPYAVGRGLKPRRRGSTQRSRDAVRPHGRSAHQHYGSDRSFARAVARCSQLCPKGGHYRLEPSATPSSRQFRRLSSRARDCSLAHLRLAAARSCRPAQHRRRLLPRSSARL
jgi:MacB-like periplasmic core domain